MKEGLSYIITNLERGYKILSNTKGCKLPYIEHLPKKLNFVGVNSSDFEK